MEMTPFSDRLNRHRGSGRSSRNVTKSRAQPAAFFFMSQRAAEIKTRLGNTRMATAIRFRVRSCFVVSATGARR